MDLEVVGRHALLFDDDANAAFVNSREALVPWNEDAALLIDRYDVRHLLDRIPPRPPTGAAKRQRSLALVDGGVSQSELDLERYHDLPPDSDDGDRKGPSSDAMIKSGETGSVAYQAVPFSYGNSESSAACVNSDSGQNSSGFHPPFPVPEGLLNNLPATEKLHQIIARTASFVATHGGQSEIVLRVKQGDNPTFGFLMPDNHLHAYFRFLVDHPQLLRNDAAPTETQGENKSDERENEAAAESVGALSLLGSVYGSGEDDDGAPQPETKETEPGNSATTVKTDATHLLNVAKEIAASYMSEQEKSPTKLVSEDKEVIKHPVAAANKEKGISSKISAPVNSASAIASFSKKADAKNSLRGAGGGPESSQTSIFDVKNLLVLEPPSFLKKPIEKSVEFILRNGREFEAALIEQDKAAGRFPFLLPSNPFHPYYLKILREAQEAKHLGKDSDKKYNGRVGSKRKSQEPPTKESSGNHSNLAYESEGLLYNPERKEKFKMALGGPKKDLHDKRSKSAQQTGVTADEAAAIVMAATRGRSPFSAFQNISMGDSDTGHASSVGSLSSLQGRKSFPNPLASSGGDGQEAISDVSVATAIAKNIARAASSEADSSEASLTKEQKLKAERLKRAKMFAAMIKSGTHSVTELMHSGSAANGSLEPLAAGSVRSDVQSDPVGKEREGSSVPFDAETSEKGPKSEKNYRSRLKDQGEDSEEDDYKHARKKHRSSEHKHGKSHHTSSKDKQPRHHHHHRHHSDSEDERKHRKSSGHRHRHKNHDMSEDEDHDRSSKHRRKHRSHSRREIEGEDSGRSKDHLEGAIDAPEQVEKVTAAVSDVKPPDANEIPNDLRAKIRAMLLETM